MITFVYDFLFLIYALVSLPKFWLRLNQAGNAKELLRERFGLLPRALEEELAGKKVVWIHAVSVGEVLAVRPFVERFLKRYPDWHAALSTTTPTGFSVAEKLSSARVSLFYAPLDLSFAVRRAFRSVRPKLVLIAETELWPQLISEAKRLGIPIGVVNGRISERAFRRYRLVRRWMKSILGKLSFCWVQSEADRSHFWELGMPADRIRIMGNMKFDEIDSDGVPPLVRRPEGLVWIAGSTSEGEEDLLLRVFERLRVSVPNLKLILAPRHPERLTEVTAAVEQHGLEFQRYSECSNGERRGPVLLVDQMGVLSQLYAWADLVFVGGSFNRRGGQNPIEAARFGKPILHGPNTANFREVYERLDGASGAFCVRTEEELLERSKSLILDAQLRDEAGERARSALRELSGAADRTLDSLSTWIENGENTFPRTPQSAAQV